MALEEVLDLDISAAQRSVDTLESDLTAAALSFTQTLQSGLVDALQILMPVEIEADAAPVTAAVDDAITAADTVAEVRADAETVTETVSAAVAAADSEIPVEATGAEQITAAIDDAVDAADRIVELETRITGPDVSTDGIGQATEDLEGLSTAAAESGDSLGKVGSAATIVNASAELAAGQMSSLRRSLPSAGTLGGVATGLAAVGATASVFANAALEAEQAENRWNLALGESAEVVARIDVGGLSADIDTLATSVGSSDERLRVAASDLFELGESSGAARTQLEETTERIVALAVRAVALRPALGDAGDNLGALTNALARGGRSAAAFGLSLGPAEITARALADTGKRAADELTVYERAAAGAAIVTGRLGTSLATDITAGSATGVVRLQALREEFGNFLEDLGRPIAPAFVDTLESAQPLLRAVAEGFAEIAEELVPLAAELLGAVTPAFEAGAEAAGALAIPLGLLADLIDVLPDELVTTAASTLIFTKVLREAALLLETAAFRAGAFTTATRAAGLASAGLLGPLGLVAGALAVGVTVIQSHRRAQEEDRKETLALADAFEAQNKSIDEFLLSETEKRFKDLIPAVRETGLTLGEIARFAAEGEDGLQELIERLVGVGKLGESDALSFASLRDAGLSAEDALDRLGRAGSFGIDTVDKSTRNLVKTFAEFQRRSQDVAREEVDRLVVSEKITNEQAVAAEQTNRLSDGTTDYLGILRDLAPRQAEQVGLAVEQAAAVDELTAAQDAFVVRLLAAQAPQDRLTAGFERADAALVGVINQFRAGTLTADEFNQVIANTGFTQDELLDALTAGRDAAEAFAETTGTDLTRALDLLGPAFAGVARQAADGTLTNEEFLTSLARSGIPAGKFTAALTQARDIVRSYVDTVTGKLPGVQDAFDELGDSPGLDEFLRKIERQARDVGRFLDNIAVLERRGAADLATVLLQQGPAAATAAAQAARLGDQALARREAQLDRGLAAEAENQQQARDLAERHGLEMAGILESNNSLLEAVPPPDLTKPIQTAAEAASDALRREGRRLATQAGADVAGAAEAAFRANQRELRILAGGFGEDIGEDYAAGLVRGALARADELFRAGERLSQNLDAGVRRKLEANSPSRLAERTAGDYVAGWVKGLSDTPALDRQLAVLLAPLREPVEARVGGVVLASPRGAAVSAPGGGVTAAAEPSAAGGVTQHNEITIQEVAADPEATAFAVASRLGQQARR